MAPVSKVCCFPTAHQTRAALHPGISELEGISATLYNPASSRWAEPESTCSEGGAHFQGHLVGRNQTQTAFYLQPIDLCTVPLSGLALLCALMAMASRTIRLTINHDVPLSSIIVSRTSLVLWTVI